MELHSKMDTEQYLSNLLLPGFSQDWEMTLPERVVFLSILQRLKPKISMEIGSRNGGSLGVISKYSESVICVDLDDTVSNRLAHIGENVQFEVGDSRIILPQLLKRLASTGQLPDFIHIDGDHTEIGASSDLSSVLSLRPNKMIFVLMHDTFNPHVRRGISGLKFNDFSHVHYADIDFMSGVFHTRPAVQGEMWGGFSVFVLKPFPRQGELMVGNYLQPQYEFVEEGAQTWLKTLNNVL